MHGFVHLCTSAEIAEFTRSLGFLSLLAAAQTPVPQLEAPTPAE